MSTIKDTLTDVVKTAMKARELDSPRNNRNRATDPKAHEAECRDIRQTRKRGTERQDSDEKHRPLRHSGALKARVAVAQEARGENDKDDARDGGKNAGQDHHAFFHEEARDDGCAHEAAAPCGAGRWELPELVSHSGHGNPYGLTVLVRPTGNACPSATGCT